MEKDGWQQEEDGIFLLMNGSEEAMCKKIHGRNKYKEEKRVGRRGDEE